MNCQCRVATNLQFVKKKKNKKQTTILQSTIKQGMPIVTLPVVGIKGCKVYTLLFILLYTLLKLMKYQQEYTVMSYVCVI